MSATTGGEGADPGVRPAATLVLLRDGPDGLEVLLTRRPRSMRFMGGALVFPGGAVADADRDPRWDEATDEAPGDRDEAAARVCALREAHEEVGLLLGRGPLERVGRHVDPGTFLESCLALGVRLGTGSLTPAGRWVTPQGSPVRFDARFFLARAPDGWEPDPDPSEVEACRWASPAGALAELARGDAIMAPPTIEMLQRLEQHPGVAEASSALADRGVGGVDVLHVRLSPLVDVVLAPNPGVMTGPGTNTYVVGTGPRVVIDPAVDDPGYLEVVRAAAGEVAAIAITHRHGDHTGGVAALVAMTGAPVRAHGGQPAGDVDVEPVADGEVLEVPGAPLVALHTPGHAADHLCFHLAGPASLFAGDVILGEGTSVIAPPDGDMRAYLDSLERLRSLHVDRIYPGHFRPLDGGEEVIEGYIRHRRRREGLILQSLDMTPRGLDEIVGSAYEDTPASLHPVARMSALAHLETLEAEGKARREGGSWAAVAATGGD